MDLSINSKGAVLSPCLARLVLPEPLALKWFWPGWRFKIFPVPETLTRLDNAFFVFPECDMARRRFWSPGRVPLGTPVGDRNLCCLFFLSYRDYPAVRSALGGLLDGVFALEVGQELLKFFAAHLGQALFAAAEGKLHLDDVTFL